MRIEQDLRIAIKAAALASKNQDRSKSEQELIAEWIKKHPAKAKAAKKLLDAIKFHAVQEDKNRKLLVDRFGLREDRFERGALFLMANERAFEKAGGSTGIKRPRFEENQVIAEYAAAKTTAEAAKVLAKYGIVWK